MNTIRRHSLRERLFGLSGKPKTNRTSSRRLLSEPLESRIMMAADSAVMNYVLQAVDADNHPVTEVYVGDTFRLVAQVQDVRTSSPGTYGVMAGYLDVRYDPSIADSPTRTITHTAPYSNLPTGEISVTSPTSAIIDDAGGFTGLSGLAQNTLYTLWTVDFVAQSPGVVTFAGEPTTQDPNDPSDPFGRDPGDDAQSPGSWTLMYGENYPVAPAGTSAEAMGGMGFVNATLTVKQGIRTVTDTATVDEDSAANRIYVLSNDIVNEGDSKQITGFNDGAHGRVAKSDNGTPADTNDDYLLYTPAENYYGTDSFTYTASDGRTTGVGTVTVTVSPVNDAPTVAITGAARLTTVEDTPLPIAVALADIDADALGGIQTTISVAQGVLRTATSIAEVTGNGTSTLIVTGPVADVEAALNGLTYTPALNFTGNDSLAVVVNDLGHTGSGGQRTASADIGITVTPVNDPPMRASGAPGPLTFMENSAPSAVPLGLSNLVYSPGGGPDEANQTVTYIVAAVPTFLQLFKPDGTSAVRANSVLTLAELAGMKYRTLPNVTGTGVLSWTVTDNGISAGKLSESVSITVTPVNDPPTRTAGTIRPIRVKEDGVTKSAASLGLSSLKYGPGGGKDEAGQTLTYTVSSIPDSVLVFKSDGKTQLLAGDSLSNTELKGLKYKTVPNAVGTGVLSWTVTDNGAPARSLTESVTITIAAVNDAPMRMAGALSPLDVLEDSAATAVSLGMYSLKYGPGGGADEAGQTLAYSLTAVPSCIQVFKPNSATALTAGAALTRDEFLGLTYQTVPNTSGTGRLTWKIADNGSPSLALTETLSVTVIAVNDAPIRTAGTLIPVNVLQDSANTTAVTLGLSSLNFGAGGGRDELRQRLKITVTAIPNYITLHKSSGANVVINATLSISDLRGLKYKTVAGRSGTGNLTWTVTDNGSPAQTLIESLPIAVAPTSPLLPAGGEVRSAASDKLSAAELQPLVTEAISRWASTGLDPAQVARLAHLSVNIADLSGQGYLGCASPNQVVIDDNGAGLGWFVDVTPNTDEEFAAGSSSPAYSRMDLLTVVMHEMGHILGLSDLDPQTHTGQLMSGTLDVGQRRSTVAHENEKPPLIDCSMLLERPRTNDESTRNRRNAEHEQATDLAITTLESN